MTTFLFTTTDSPLSRAIRALTRSPVSHCAMGLDFGGVAVVTEASLLGIEMTNRARWLRGLRVVAEYQVPEDVAPPDWFVAASLGEGYDGAGLLGYLPVYLYRWLGKAIANPWASPARRTCSEYLVRGVQARGQWTDFDPETFEPCRLMRLCEALGWPRV